MRPLLRLRRSGDNVLVLECRGCGAAGDVETIETVGETGVIHSGDCPARLWRIEHAFCQRVRGGRRPASQQAAAA